MAAIKEKEGERFYSRNRKSVNVGMAAIIEKESERFYSRNHKRVNVGMAAIIEKESEGNFDWQQVSGYGVDYYRDGICRANKL